RIDRLTPEEKRLLQTASVIGKDVPFALLQAIAGLPGEELRGGLGRLQAREFLHETRLFPDLEYTFKHALTQEVAYGSLLRDQQRVIHARIVAAIEELYPEHLGEQLERLAHHALRGELWDKALTYFRDAGRKAMVRGAYRGAIACLEQALLALEHLPKTREFLEQAIDLRFRLRHSLLALGDAARILEHLRATETLAKALGDQRRLVRLATYMTDYFGDVGENERAIEAGRHASALASELGDLPLQLEAEFYLAEAYYAVGDYSQAIALLTRNVAVLDQVGTTQRAARLLSAIYHTFLALSFDMIGDFAQGLGHAQQAVQIAEATGHPFQVVWASFGIGAGCCLKGDIVDTAIPTLERSLRLCEGGDMLNLAPAVAAQVGYLYARAGRFGEAIAVLGQPAAPAVAGFRTTHYLPVAGDAYLIAGRADLALEVASHSMEVSRNRKERGHEAFTSYLLGEIASRSDPPKMVQAEDCYRQAMVVAEELGMRPLLARCHLGLGKLYRRTGDRPKAQEYLTTAITMLREMDMRFWLEQAEAELKALGSKSTKKARRRT
ncbi:MAG: tetratricopeptide repeat protein, partial [Candidatus Methylomirabilia bacterium]